MTLIDFFFFFCVGIFFLVLTIARECVIRIILENMLYAYEGKKTQKRCAKFNAIFLCFSVAILKNVFYTQYIVVCFFFVIRQPAWVLKKQRKFEKKETFFCKMNVPLVHTHLEKAFVIMF